MIDRVKRVVYWDEPGEYSPVIVHDQDIVEFRRQENPWFGIRIYSLDHASRIGLVQLPLWQIEFQRSER